GYTGGSWPTYNALVAAFPHAYHLSIAINASSSGRCLDVEPGDASNGEEPGWFNNHPIKTEGKPVLYTSASNVQALIDTMSGAGIPRPAYLVWSAHYGWYHICGNSGVGGGCSYPLADGTQFNDVALGRNLDESVLNDSFFGPPAPP